MRGLTDTTKAMIVVMRKHGLSYRVIGRELKITKGQVAGVLWRANLCKPKETKHVTLSDYRVA